MRTPPPVALIMGLAGATGCATAHGDPRRAAAPPNLAAPTPASRAATAAIRRHLEQLGSGSPAPRETGFAGLSRDTATPATWTAALAGLAPDEITLASDRVAPYLDSPQPGVRETALLSMHRLHPFVEEPPSPRSARWAAAYAQRLVLRHELSPYEQANRALQLTQALQLLRTATPSRHTSRAVRAVLADPELAELVSAKRQLGWASAWGALQEAQKIQSAWDPGARLPGVGR